MSRKGITCRFRKTLDADLITATQDLGDGELSELTRNGLRVMLGIRTTRHMEMKEKPLLIPGTQGIRVTVPPVPEQKEKTAQPPQRPAAVLFTNTRD